MNSRRPLPAALRTALRTALLLLLLLAGRGAAAPHIFRGEPEFEVKADGRVLVSWRSTKPMAPGRVNYGVALPEDPFREPRMRIGARALGDGPSFEHRAELRLDSVQRPRIDAADQREAGGGEVEVRLELYSDEDGRAYLSYHRFAYAGGEGDWRRMPCVSSGPWLDRLAPSEAWLSCDLDLPARVVVAYGPAGEEGAWRRETLPASAHVEFALAGLAPETDYAYSLQPLDGAGRGLPARSWRFRTPPATGVWPEEGVLRLAFLSDSRGGSAGLDENVNGTNRRMIRLLLAQAELAGADAVCFGGDLIDGYTSDPDHYRAQLTAWKRAAECIGPRLPIYECMGNHEMLQDDYPDIGGGYGFRDKKGPINSETLFAEAFVNPENGPAAPAGENRPPFTENVYSFDIGPVHVVAMNNTYCVATDPEEMDGYREGYFPDEEIAWLDGDLAAARAAGQQEIFLFTHEPAFPCGGHSGDGMYWNGEKPEMLAMRDRFWTVLMRHRVRAVFFGDEHNYSRLRLDSRLDDFYAVPVWQIVSGGAGAPFYNFETQLPWSPLVAAFSAVQHFCLIEASAQGVRIKAIDPFGRLVDEAELN